MSWGYPMRFRLSSVFLMIALVAVLLAWYVDHRHPRSDNIVGVWYYPDRYPSKGRETLTISRDGTFTHEQATWGGLMTSGGTYTLVGNGIVEFHVASKRFEQGGTHPKIDTLEVDRTYRCRIARDSYANLIVVDLAPRAPWEARVETRPDDVDIDWRCYTSTSHDAQRQAWEEWFRGICNSETDQTSVD